MFTYETGILTFKQMKRFCAEFESEVGTEYEVNKLEDDAYYINCYEVTRYESNTCRGIEHEAKSVDTPMKVTFGLGS